MLADSWPVNLGPPTETEIGDGIRALNHRKAAGPDYLVPALFKEGGQTLVRASTQLFELIWETEQVPTS